MKAFYLATALALLFSATPSLARTITPETPEERAMLQEADKQDHAGAAMLERGEYAIAELDFQRALAVFPQDSTAYRGLAESLTGLGQTEQAIGAYRALIYATDFRSTTASEVRTLVAYAILLNETGQWREAVTMYDRALPFTSFGATMPRITAAFTPERPQPTLFAAAAYITLGVDASFNCDISGNPQRDRAMVEYQKALKLEPNWDLANFYYVYGLMNTNHPKEAQPAFNRLLDLNPNTQIRAALKTLYGVVGKIDLTTGRPVINK